MGNLGGSKSPAGWRETVIQAITAVAGVTAIAGVGVWLDEKSDREEERRARIEERDAREAEAEARRMGLIGQALDTIAKDAADGEVDTSKSPVTRWAIETLLTYQLPVEITAQRVNLTDIDFTCATLRVDAGSLRLSEVRLLNSDAPLKVDAFSLYNSGVGGSKLHLTHREFRSRTRAHIENSEIADSEITLFYSPVGPIESTPKPPSVFQRFNNRIDVLQSRLKNLTLYRDGKFQFELFGADQPPARIPEPECEAVAKRENTFFCPPKGSDAPPRDNFGKLTSEVSIDLTPPPCKRPSEGVSSRFRKFTKTAG